MSSCTHHTSKKIIRNNFVILSGCSGGGKSTILLELKKQGFRVVEEPGRKIVQDELSSNGEALPWNNLDKFLEKALEKNISNFCSIGAKDFVFFDRSIVDTVLSTEKENKALKAARIYRYHYKVFLTPPWQEIYKNDSERKHSYADAVQEYERLIENFKSLGYEVVILPKKPVEERVKFILENLSYLETK